MGKTKIEWADAVWNPVTGCTKVSAGCAQCYAERMAKRLAGRYGYPADDPFKVTLHPDRLEQPLRWRKSRRVFVNSMSDLFHEDVPYEFIDKVFAVMALCPQHTFQVLTKRPKEMGAYLNLHSIDFRISQAVKRLHLPTPYAALAGFAGVKGWPLPNVWLGTSCEDQPTADKRIPELLKCPAEVTFLSLEPMLGPIDLSPWIYQNACGCLELENDVDPDNCPHCKGTGAVCALDWVIAGGESGPGARPMDPDWPRGIRDQCQAAGVPFFFKQWDGVHKKQAGRMLDGRTWDEMPVKGETN